jgi:hypothetical protein
MSNTQNTPDQRPLITTRRLAESHSVTPRTIFRWVKDGILPAPDKVINGRKYWRADRADRKPRNTAS